MCLLDQVSSSLSKKHEWPWMAGENPFLNQKWKQMVMHMEIVQLSCLTTTRYEYIQEKYKSIVNLSNDAKH